MHFGIAHDNPHLIEADLLRYDACISCEDITIEPRGEIFQKYLMEESLPFLHKGSYENLKTTYDKISPLGLYIKVLRDTPMFEKCLNRDPRRTKHNYTRKYLYL